MRFPKIKKKKKTKPEYIPVYIGGANKETEKTFVVGVAVKALLACMASMGLCATLAQIYLLPVSMPKVFFTCFMATALFNVAFLLLKKRALALLAAPLLLFVRFEDVSLYLSTFFDYLMHVLDGRLLSTARYASRSLVMLENSYTYIMRIEWTFLLLCVIISLIFTIGSRSRYMGSFLVTTVFLLTPSFVAEIARYVSGMALLISGMVGNYAMWVSHAGGYADIPKAKKGKKGKKKWLRRSKVYKKAVHLSENKENVKAKAKDKAKEPFYKLYPGRPPHFYKYTRNAIAASVISLAALFISAGVFPSAVSVDLTKVAQGFAEFAADIPNGVQKFFKYNFGSISDSGYFSSGNISQGISAGSPPKGNVPVIEVTLKSNADNVYLRGGIGIDFKGDEWTDSQKSAEFEQLEELLQDFYPEIEYQVYRQKLALLGYEPEYYIGLQEVKVDYLTKANFILLPTQTYDLYYKDSSNYNWFIDTIIKPKGNTRINGFSCYSLYPKMSNGSFSAAYATVLNNDDNYSEIMEIYRSMFDDIDFFDLETGLVYFGDVEWVLPDGMTTEEYNSKIEMYNELINSVYTNVPFDEYDNIETLLYEMGLDETGHITTVTDVVVEEAPDYYITYSATNTLYGMDEIQYICDYLKYNYGYSLTVDNKSGDNTLLGNFLFDTKQGHCAMYATAMTLAARQLGYTARYVTGVVTSGKGNSTDDGYGYSFAENNFHAWCEVYFPGLGWIPFDPTGTGGRNTASDSNATSSRATTSSTAAATTPATTTSSATTEPAQTTATQSSDDNTKNSDQIGGIATVMTVIVIILIPVFLAASAVMAFNTLKKKETQKLSRYKKGGDNKTAEEMYRFMFSLLKAEGISFGAKGEPPAEFALRVDETLGNEDLSLSGIMPVFEKLEFSNFELEPHEYDSLYGYVAALYDGTVTQKPWLKRLVRRIRFIK